MAEGTPLSRSIDEFGGARGEEMDGVWAFSTSWSLLMRDVDVALVVEGLHEALAVVRETQESPEDLFGTPRAYAEDLYERWRAEGRLVLDDGRTSWRDSVAIGLGLSAFCAVVALVLLVVRDETGAAALLRVVGISLVVGLGAAVGEAVWRRRHRRPVPGPGVPDDARWAVELTEILRSRHAMSGPRVRGIVDEAHAHAAESGCSVRDEFGTPEEYAAHFAPDLTRRSLFTAACLVVLVLIDLVLVIDGPHWSNVGLLLGIGWLAIVEHRKYRTLRAR